MQVEAPSPTKTATGLLPLPLFPKISEGLLQVISSCEVFFGYDWRFAMHLYSENEKICHH